MSPAAGGTVPHRGAPAGAASTWGPYYDTLHPQRAVHMMTAWKVVPRWVEAAKALWRLREELRHDYESAHGKNPSDWPSQHPGVVLDGIPACLRCHWLGPRNYYRRDHVFQSAADIARRHERSNGEFVGAMDDRLMPTARRTPDPPVVQTSPIPRRLPPQRLRIVDRYTMGRNRTQ